MDDNDNTSLTTAKTLWTETILEILYQSLKDNKPDAAIRELLNEVKLKGFKPEEIIQKVEKKLGRPASIRARGLLQKMG